ncbi:hypothetical protein [Ruminiclostridium cellulolyticum]|uniref:Uncharacterized protein n=1 Tax=Ruminiclostridium cellulolyticum (strain ATCC 35319 / DSM 5812 / JCM 6584 / H10) TaxID=394503 RepID=B8I0X0_RUMCH|nr:hypothetical protein [Ruminiclostridium cellulolyticum]ACL77526.1 hypothetical protein Ccel_3236 [Ruminiclostridium cellulolyticum H10]
MKTLSGALLISTGCIMVLVLKILQILFINCFSYQDLSLVWFAIFMSMILGAFLIVFDNISTFQYIKKLCTLKFGLALLTGSLISILFGLKRLPIPFMQVLSLVLVFSIIIIIINLLKALKTRKR